MWKPMLAGTVALALTGSTLALAQQGSAPSPGSPNAQAAPAPTGPAGSAPGGAAAQKPSAQLPGGPEAAQDRAAQERAAALREREADERAEVAGRVASLRAGLMLTDEQKAKWPAFEKAWQDFAKVRLDQWRQFRETRRSDDPFAAMRARAQFAVARGTAMKEFSDAAQPLYESLNEAQQRRFRNVVFASLMPRPAAFGARWRDRDDDDRRGDSERWSRGGDDGDGCSHGQYGWRHHPRMQGYWRDRDDDDRPGRGWRGDEQRYGSSDQMGPRGRDGDQMGPHGHDGMGPRMGQGPRSRAGQDRDDDDDADRGSADNDSDGRRGARMGPDEERF